MLQFICCLALAPNGRLRRFYVLMSITLSDVSAGGETVF